jgi:hypothetical protein
MFFSPVLFCSVPLSLCSLSLSALHSSFPVKLYHMGGKAKFKAEFKLYRVQMIICALQGRLLRRRPIQKGHYWGNSRPFPCPALPPPPEPKWRRSDSEGGTVQ